MVRLFDSRYSKMDVIVAICSIMILTLVVGMMTWSIFTPEGHFKGTQGELISIYEPYIHQLEKGAERNEKSR